MDADLGLFENAQLRGYAGNPLLRLAAAPTRYRLGNGTCTHRPAGVTVWRPHTPCALRRLLHAWENPIKVGDRRYRHRSGRYGLQSDPIDPRRGKGHAHL